MKKENVNINVLTFANIFISKLYFSIFYV